jgi:hypothetical protein
VFQVIGVFVGGLLSGAFANRIGVTVEKGPRISRTTRLVFAASAGPSSPSAPNSLSAA